MSECVFGTCTCTCKSVLTAMAPGALKVCGGTDSLLRPPLADFFLRSFVRRV